MTTILIDSTLNSFGSAMLFELPEEIIEASQPEDIPKALSRLEEVSAAGLYAAGFFSYELGYCLEPRLADRLPSHGDIPLLWFGVFTRPAPLSPGDILATLDNKTGNASDYSFTDFHLNQSRQEYHKNFEVVKNSIAAGEIYQMNLTFGADFSFQGNIYHLYRDLKHKQKMQHGALLDHEAFSVISASPELFLTINDGEALTGPMKGTARRGMTNRQDQRQTDFLRNDEKSRAENLMIVDLMRNDLSKISETGSVSVSDLFAVETYPTLHQMTSYIRSRLKKQIRLADWLQALFPPGSITGAPKVRAMEIINDLEKRPRGVYTGAIGVIEPEQNNSPRCYFNVAIRTLTIHSDGRGTMGIGSGVVSDSDADAEYDECRLKMKFLTDPVTDFQLIETFAYLTDKGYQYFPWHLKRLQNSAQYFDFKCDLQTVRSALKAEEEKLNNKPHRVRLLLSMDGSVNITSTPVEPPAPDTVMTFVLSDIRMRRDNIFLYHKTTNRAFYDDEHKAMSEKHNCDEVIFMNEDGELTEGSRTNIFIEKDGELYTPAVASGLLEGTMRAELLDRGRIKEKVLFIKDLEKADAVYIGNSVRGMLKGQWIRT